MPHRDLDRTDFDLIRLLQKNARTSNKELAAAVRIAPSTSLERVRRLEADGVLTGYHADVSPRTVGVGLEALVWVTLRQHARPLVESFMSHALAREEVVQLFHTTGANDFLVHVAVRDTQHLRELALSAFTERPEVARIETALLFAHLRADGMPIYGDEPSAAS
jgi:DNA-binding Lrp family transcriptional regulator